MADSIIDGRGSGNALGVDEYNSAYVRLRGISGADINIISGGIVPVDTNTLLTQAFALNASSQTEYIGWTQPGQGAWIGSDVWRIQKLGYDSSKITSGLAWASGAGGHVTFDKNWNDRGSYTYE